MMSERDDQFTLAVVGMSARFPGAPNIEEFWKNLIEGRESVTWFSAEELVACGADPEVVHATDFVRARPILEGFDRFAARLFAYSPREAELMDPQHRLFLECAWNALEDAGYAPRHVPGHVGVYAACSLNTYLLANVLGSQVVGTDEEFQAMIGSDKD
jgi:acyl transferase domain-containing protein